MHLGINRRIQDVVFGLESDLEYADITGSGVGTTNAIHSTDIDWMGSLRARFGIVSDSTLFYVTGGLAFAKVTTAQRLVAGGVPYAQQDDVMTGWTAGGGIEQMIGPQLSLRLEYRYSDFGSVSHFDSALNMVESTRLDTHAIRAGVSVQF